MATANGAGKCKSDARRGVAQGTAFACRRRETSDTDNGAEGLYHHFTVDVEECFQISAMEPWISRASWEGFPRRSPAVVARLLDAMEAHGHRGTFFVVGWLAEREPAMVREISARGHEVASHGWGHEKVSALNRESFRDSVRRSREVLEGLAGSRVTGYRAPSFSIDERCGWALDILVEEGYEYDSSLFPVRHFSYGNPNGKRDPHVLERTSGRLIEIPPATVRIMGRNIPAAGGAYLRFFPLSVTRAGLLAAERRGVAGTLYIHPWELEPDQPRLPSPLLPRLRTYGGVKRTWPRVERLFSEFQFRPIRESVAALREAGRPESVP